MLHRLYRIGRSFIFPQSMKPSTKTVELLLADGREKSCGTCRFYSDIRRRCMRQEGDYFKAPVPETHICWQFEPEVDDPIRDEHYRGLLCRPRGNPAPRGHAAGLLAIEELVRRKPTRKCDCRGCRTCHYNPLRFQGVEYPGCSFPGETHMTNGIDGGKFCKVWLKGGEAPQTCK